MSIMGELTTVTDRRNFMMQLLPYLASKFGERPMPVHTGEVQEVVADDESLAPADVLKIVGEQ